MKQNHNPPDFLVHDQTDSVGVIVVEGVAAGQNLSGWIMDTDDTISIEARQEIPLGHKIALSDHEQDTNVIKYGFPIGRTTAEIKKGEHLHVHNTKTEKW